MRALSGAVLLSVAALAITTGCQGKKEEEQAFARVGNREISMRSFDAFQRMKKFYPSPLDPHFPGERNIAAFAVETELLYRKARSSAAARKQRRSADWEWKHRYFPAQLYIAEVLDPNLGFTDEQVEERYEERKDDFMTTIKVPVEIDTTLPDSIQEALRDSTKDTTMYRPLVEVRGDIIEELFIEQYPPSAAFMGMLDSQALADTAHVHHQWIQTVRRRLPDFFMERLYEQKYGEPMPDSLDEWYGEGKPVTPDDMEVILGWLEEHQRDQQDLPAAKRHLAQWLLKWKLLAEKAERSGFAARKDVQNVLEWAEKYDIVTAYIRDEIIPSVEEGVQIDTAMAVYAGYDASSRILGKLDSTVVQDVIAKLEGRVVRDRVDSEIYSLRQKANVEYLQSDWTDPLSQKPRAIAAEADSMLAAGETAQAKKLYEQLTKSFAFTSQGREALVELAKLQTESGQYTDAIKNYRWHLVTTADTGVERCNTFFMIGFIYDEYLSKPLHAEVNYKWILEHTPECDLADDAEFMVLHLDEPMTSVEQLRAEARRQGRVIEDEEEAPAGDVTDATGS